MLQEYKMRILHVLLQTWVIQRFLLQKFDKIRAIEQFPRQVHLSEYSKVWPQTRQYKQTFH